MCRILLRILAEILLKNLAGGASALKSGCIGKSIPSDLEIALAPLGNLSALVNGFPKTSLCVGPKLIPIVFSGGKVLCPV